MTSQGALFAAPTAALAQSATTQASGWNTAVSIYGWFPSFGGQTTFPTVGNPIVHGKLVVDPKAPTVTVYNHLDVQPGGEPPLQGSYGGGQMLSPKMA